MALSSASTETDALNQYRDNLGWMRVGTLAAAHAFREAIVFLLGTRAEAYSTPGFSLSRSDLTPELDRVTAWIEENGTTATSDSRPRATRLRPSPGFRR